VTPARLSGLSVMKAELGRKKSFEKSELKTANPSKQDVPTRPQSVEQIARMSTYFWEDQIRYRL
jgi:hypothetical protein